MSLHSSFYKSALEHLLIIVVFLLITSYFFSSSMFGDATLPQNDIIQWRAGAKELIDYRKQTDTEGLWTDSMFGGMPSTLVSTEYSGDLFQNIEQWYNLGFTGPERIFISLFFSMYIMLLLFGVRPLLAALGSIIFCLSSYHIIGIVAGHNARIRAVSYIPLIIGGINYAYQKNKWLGGLIFSVGLVFELRVNHLQITYYYLFVLLLFGLYYLWLYIKRADYQLFMKVSGVLILGAVLAVGANYGRLSMILDYSKHSIRGKSELNYRDTPKEGLSKEYAFEYNNGLIEPLTMFFPHIMGGGSQEDIGLNSNLAKALKDNAKLNTSQIRQQVKGAPLYFGKQKYTLPYHLGFVSYALFVLGLLILPRKQLLLLLSIFLLGICFSWGKNLSGFNYFLFDYFPGFNKFRSVTFAITISHFSCAMICVLGLHHFFLLAKIDKVRCDFVLKRTIYIVAGTVLILVLVSYIGRFSGPVDSNFVDYKWFLKALRADRTSLLREDALSLLLFSSAVFLVLLNFIIKKIKLNFTVSLVIIIILCIINLIGFNSQYLNADKFRDNPYKSFYTPEPSDAQIKMDDDIHYRVAGLINPFNDAKISIHHKSIGGYHGAKLRRYQDIIEWYLSYEIDNVSRQIADGKIDSDRPILNMLNTKYFKFGAKAHSVVPNRDSYGHGWFPSVIKSVYGPLEEIKGLKNTDLKEVAIIDKSKFTKVPSVATDNSSTVSLTGYSPNKMTYKVSSNSGGLVVFSELYYPYWKAYVGKEELPVVRVNYILRGVEVPKGQSMLSFVYEDPNYSFGNMIMLISSIILLLCIVLSLIYTIRLSFMSIQLENK